MILADKVIALRKKNGWSQEELAERVGVTRQAVSKWEGAQSAPDLNKVLQLAQAFGVSTDYLLRDELEEAEYADTADTPALRRVSMEEANAFLAVKRKTGKRVALAVGLCVLSPQALLLLGAASAAGVWGVTEGLAGGVGLAALLVLCAAAVAVFIACGAQSAPYEYLEKEAFETEYGVSGMVRERQRQSRAAYTRANILGASLCILSAVPLLCGAFLAANELALMALLSLTMLLAGAGAMVFIVAGIHWASLQKLLEEGEYARKNKARGALGGAVATVYWLVVVAVYLGLSFAANDWESSWIVWPIAGVLFAAVMAIFNAVAKAKA